MQQMQVHSLPSELLDTVCHDQGDSAQIRRSDLMQVKALLFKIFCISLPSYWKSSTTGEGQNNGKTCERNTFLCQYRVGLPFACTTVCIHLGIDSGLSRENRDGWSPYLRHTSLGI